MNTQVHELPELVRRYQVAHEAVQNNPAMLLSDPASGLKCAEAMQQLEFARNAMFAALKASPVQAEAIGRACKWHQQDEGYDTFSTACGHEYTVNDCTDGNVGLPYCPFCARRLEGHAWAADDEAHSVHIAPIPQPPAASVVITDEASLRAAGKRWEALQYESDASEDLTPEQHRTLHDKQIAIEQAIDAHDHIIDEDGRYVPRAASVEDVEAQARELLEEFPLPAKVSSANGYDAAWASGFNDAVDLCQENCTRAIAAALRTRSGGVDGWRVAVASSGRQGDAWEIYDEEGNGGVVSTHDVKDWIVRKLLDRLAIIDHAGKGDA